jgi:hypothetical protein
MEALVLVLVVADIYLIVYYRLMVGHWREKATGRRESGLVAAISYASRKDLPPEGLRYYRRYWYAVGALAAIVLIATAVRLPALRAAFGA